MELIIFGVAVGLMMGTGLYLLVIRPLAQERKQDKERSASEDQGSP